MNDADPYNWPTWRVITRTPPLFLSNSI
jgi:hypothetical protein